jgi:IPT/TIG domain
LSYAKPPYVESISACWGSFDGGRYLQLQGRRFGSGDNDVVAVFLGAYKCTNVTRHSKTWLTCTTPAIDVNELGLGPEGIGLSLIVLSMLQTCTALTLLFKRVSAVLVSPTLASRSQIQVTHRPTVVALNLIHACRAFGTI